MMLTTLTTFNGELRVDSRIIAKALGESHKALYRLIKHNAFDFRRFGLLPFDIGAIPLRGKPERFALLNREQVDRLLTFFDDAPDVCAFRASLDEAFGGQPATVQPAIVAAAAALMPFSFESRQIRAFNIDGNPWFVGKDVAEALGYQDPTTAIRSHCKGVQKLHPIVDRLGRTQEVRILNEPDVYRLVAGSHLPEAMRFEAWLFEEVLPEIRKTGSYTLPGAQSAIVKPVPLSAALRASINQRAWYLAQSAFDDYRAAMQATAQRNPAFNPERWMPVDCFPAALDEADFGGSATWRRSLKRERDLMLFEMRQAGMTYPAITEATKIPLMTVHNAVCRVARNIGRVAV